MNRQSAAAVIDAARFNRTHWLILGWGCFIMLFDGYDMVIYGSVVPRLMQEWQLSPVQAGTLGSCALFGMLFGGTLLAPLADRFGRRRLVIATTLLASLAAFLTGHARDPLELGAGRFFTGLALGALVPSAINLISEFAPAGRRSTLVTVMSAFYSVGAVLSALLAIAMIPAWGWQSVFYVAVLPVLAVPLMLRWLPESAAFLELKGRRAELDALLRKVDPDYRPGAERANAVAAEAPSGRVAQLFEGRQAVGTLLLWVAFAMCMLMSYGLNTWLPKLMAGGGYALGSSLAFLVTLNVGATLGALFGGWLADRLGAGRTLVLFFALAAASLAALGLGPGPWLLNGLLVVAGATTIGTLAVIHAYAAQFYPAWVRSTGVGWAAGVGRLGAIAGPMLGGSLLLEIEQADRDDLDAAYAKAAEVQPAWAALGPSARAAVLYKAVEVFDRRHEEIVDWIIRESGSTRLKAEIEWGAARAITLESASFPARVHGRIVESDVPGKESRVYRSAIGVVGVISPWNFPLHLTQRSIAPALALGNAVVVKPASDTPVCGGLLLARIFEEAGLPAGLFSVVVGPGSEIGDAFVEHPVPGLVTFTGSTPVGRNIGRIASGGAHLKHVALELGGNSPFVVLGDADLEQAVNAAVFGKFLHQGQICMAINRIIVEDSLYDAFAARFVERVKGLRVGDPQRADTAVGPIVNARQLEGLLEKIRLARQEGAKPLYEGGVDGQLLAPHVFGEVTATMEIARDEIFGPLVGLLRARDEAHALELANASEYGLSSAVFSRDLERAVRFARQLRAGMTHVNDIPVNDEANAPFGGEKNSGLGRFNGDWAIEEFTTDHWISVQHAPRQYPF